MKLKVTRLKIVKLGNLLNISSDDTDDLTWSGELTNKILIKIKNDERKQKQGRLRIIVSRTLIEGRNCDFSLNHTLRID